MNALIAFILGVIMGSIVCVGIYTIVKKAKTNKLDKTSVTGGSNKPSKSREIKNVE